MCNKMDINTIGHYFEEGCFDNNIVVNNNKEFFEKVNPSFHFFDRIFLSEV